jgi:hypothetical protein
VSDTVPLAISTPVVDAQFLGLGALGVAFLLAVTRMSVRRRPVPATAGGRGAARTGRTGTTTAPAESAKAKAEDSATSTDSAADANDGSPATLADPWESAGAQGSLDDTQVIDPRPAAVDPSDDPDAED